MDPLLHGVDCVTVPVPDLDEGLRFYRDSLGHELLWRNDAVGQAGLRLPRSDTEIVLTVHEPYEPAWLVSSAGQAAAVVENAGGRVLEAPRAIRVRRAALTRPMRTLHHNISIPTCPIFVPQRPVAAPWRPAHC